MRLASAAVLSVAVACGGEDVPGARGAGGSSGSVADAAVADAPPSKELGGDACSNRIDDDGDGLVDCDDPDCTGLLWCAEVTGTACSDGEDNDDDGAIDCDDTDCAGLASCVPVGEVTAAACSNGNDDDGDGDQDCDDEDCRGFVFCAPGAVDTELDADRCSDGVDNDLDGATDCADTGCGGFTFCREDGPDACVDGADNDGDGLADCDDPTCHVALPPGACRPARLVFVGDPETDGATRLYAANLDGSGRRDISGALASGSVGVWQLSPDGAHAAFAASIASSRLDLWVSPLGADAPPRRVSGNVTAGLGVNGVAWADATRLVYRSDDAVPFLFKIHATTLAGGPPFDITGPFAGGGSARDLGALSPDGSRLAFRADPVVDGRIELWVGSTHAASPPALVSGAMLAEGDARPTQVFSPDGTKVAFRADLVTDEAIELWVTDAAGAAPPVNVSGTIPPASLVADVLWSPKSDRLAFRADKDVPGVQELYVADPAGATPARKVSGPLVAGGAVSAMAFTPPGTRVVFRADKDTDGTQELFIANADGSGGIAKLSGALVPGGTVGAGFLLSRDGLWVFFVADAEVDGRFDLYRVEIATLTRERLVTPAVPGGAVESIVGFSPDATKLAVLGDLDVLDRRELYVLDPDGSGRVAASGALVAGGNVNAAAWTPSLPVRTYLPDGAPCAEGASCRSLVCTSGRCE